LGAIRDLAEQFWNGEVVPRELWKPTGQSEELAPGMRAYQLDVESRLSPCAPIRGDGGEDGATERKD
jgi:hypothetical protein